MKKILTFLIIILFPSTLFAGYGKGELKLTESGVKGFYTYLQGKKGAPMRAVVNSDGTNFYWLYCPHMSASRCASSSDTRAIKYCERKQPLPCATFAVGRSVKWKNGINKGGKPASFKKSMTLDEVREKLAALGFLKDSSKASTTNTSSKSGSNKVNISTRLQSLINMHEKGLLTDEEFKTAKQKLLK